jgi:hypothetical protein
VKDSDFLDGLEAGPRRLEQARELLGDQPAISRWKLSRQLAERWGFYSPSGQLRDMAVRTWLLKMEAAGRLVLPPRRCVSPNRMRHRKVQPVAHGVEPVLEALAQLQPVELVEVSSGGELLRLFEWLLHRYHYLSYRSTVGLNLKYLARDRWGRPLACVLFGSAAWQCAPRDRWIGWTDPRRQERLNQITNNTRFLILPWVRAPHLASHLLGQVAARVRADWWRKYRQEVFLLETFVERGRFAGTCYQAAGWICVGQTQGRSRQDRTKQLRVPIKDIYLKPLGGDFAARLGRS